MRFWNRAGNGREEQFGLSSQNSGVDMPNEQNSATPPRPRQRCLGIVSPRTPPEEWREKGFSLTFAARRLVKTAASGGPRNPKPHKAPHETVKTPPQILGAFFLTPSLLFAADPVPANALLDFEAMRLEVEATAVLSKPPENEVVERPDSSPVQT